MTETVFLTSTTPHVSHMYPASTPQGIEILKAAASGEKTREELQTVVQIKDREHFRKSPVYVKDGNMERFYIRTGPSSTELTASQIQEYIKQRFSV